MTSGGNGGKPIREYERAAAQNDFVKWHNTNRGYVSCEVTPASGQPTSGNTPGCGTRLYLTTPGSFVIEAGIPVPNVRD